jgi:hypothetical protein
LVSLLVLAALCWVQPAAAARQEVRPTGRATIQTGEIRRALKNQEGSGPGWCARYGGYQLGAEYDGVYACGPSTGMSNPFDSVGFQCVELSARFLWVVYGRYVTNIPDGADFVAAAHRQIRVRVGRPGPGSVPATGDIVSINGGAASFGAGHTAVVAATNVDANGNGRIRLIEENASSSGWGVIYVRDWVESYAVHGDGGVNIISWLELSAQPIKLPAGQNVRFAILALGRNTTVTGIDKAGEVTGLKTFAAGPGYLVRRPFIFSSGQLTVLPAPASVGALTESAAINDERQVAASAEVAHTASAAFEIGSSRKHRWFRLPNPLSPVGASAALGINDRGAIAGWVAGKGVGAHTFGAVWTRRQTTFSVHVFRPAPRFTDVRIYASDRAGDAVGTETSDAGVFYPTIWVHGAGTYRLPAAPGDPPSAGSASAISTGKAVGRRVLSVIGASASGNSVESTEWRIRVNAGRVTVFQVKHLGLVSQAQQSVAAGANSRGWIVGDSIAPRKEHSAQLGFLVRPGIGMIPLSLMVAGKTRWEVVSAAGVNAVGQVAAEGYASRGSRHGPQEGLLLSPVAKRR